MWRVLFSFFSFFSFFNIRRFSIYLICCGVIIFISWCLYDSFFHYCLSLLNFKGKLQFSFFEYKMVVIFHFS